MSQLPTRERKEPPRHFEESYGPRPASDQAGLLGGGFKKGLRGLLDPDNLARAASFFVGDYGQAAQITDSMQRRGLLADKLKAKQAEEKAGQEAIRQRAEILQAKGLSPQEAWALAGDDTALRQMVVPEKESPYRFKDNAGNLMEYAGGETRALSIDPQDRTYFNNGAMVTVPNTRRNQPPVGTIKGGYRFNGGDPANPASWQPVDNIGGENIPIPRLGGR